MRELRRRIRADQSQARFEPCLPRLAKQPPTGPGWIHEIKHDGFRIIAQREADTVRLITRNGHDFSGRFPLIVAAVAAVPARSCVLDGEAIGNNGRSVFEIIRWRQYDAAVTCQSGFGPIGWRVKISPRIFYVRRPALVLDALS